VASCGIFGWPTQLKKSDSLVVAMVKDVIFGW
jgi:hypothetical protein